MRPTLVPNAWKLMRMRPGQRRKSWPRPCSASTCSPTGAIVLSNGSAVERLSPDGKRETLCRDACIEQVIALG